MTTDESTTDERLYGLTTANRHMIADVLESLDEAQWSAPSLCDGWTVRDVAGHLLQPIMVGFGRFFVTSLRYRGDTDRTIDHLTRQLARQSPAELVAQLREHAGDRVSPPRVGPVGPFAETCIHLRDCARPLGLAADVSVEQWRLLLDQLTSTGAPAALCAPGRLDGLSFAATDVDWSSGLGEPVTGPAEAIGMAITGRPAALADLQGAGVARLASRL